MTLARAFAPLSLYTSIALTRADARFGRLREQVDAPLFLVAPRSGLILDVNHKAVELTGYARNELSELSLSELIPSGDGSPALDVLWNLADGLSRRIADVPFRMRNGAIVRADVRASDASERYDGEPILLLLVTPPTAPEPLRNTRRGETDSAPAPAAVAPLSTIETLSTLLVACAPDAADRALEVCRAMLPADAAGLYRVQPQRPGLQRIGAANLPRQFPPQLTPSDPSARGELWTWQRGDSTESALAMAGRAAGCEYLLACPLGDAQASTGLFVAAFNSLPADPPAAAARARAASQYLANLIVALVRRRADEVQRDRSRRAAQQLSAIRAGATDGIVEVSSAGRVTGLNSAAERLLGFAEQDVLDTDINNVVVDSDAAAPSVFAVLSSGEAATSHERALVRRDGQTIATLVTTRPIWSPNAEFAGGVILISDRTEHKTFAEQSRHLAQRAFLGDMSSIFAHEIRNPLNGITTGLQYIAMRSPQDDTLNNSVAKMLGEVNRIEQILKSTLQIARPDRMKLQPTNVREVIDRLLHHWGHRIERRSIELSVDEAEDTPLAMADGNLLEQVFRNLIQNAMEAMGPEGGTIKIRLSGVKDDSENNSVCAEVSDSGPGMPAERLEKIFKPFFTTKTDGTGLGLALSLRIVDAHRGRMEVQSWIGAGTIFSIFLPTAAATPTRPGTDFVTGK